MPLNTEYKGYYWADEYGMFRIHPDYTDGKDWENSVGETVLAWIAYGQDPESPSIPSLLYCYSHNCRHPQYPGSELSRDHLSYLLVFRRLFFGGYSNLPVNRRGMYLWSRAIQYNKTAEFLYYATQIPGAYFRYWWNSLIRRMGRCGTEISGEMWGYEPMGWDITIGEFKQQSLTKWQKFWLWGPRYKWRGKEKKIELLIPTYTLHNKAWQLYVMRKSPKRDTLCKILLKSVGKYNYLLRLMFGDTTVTKEEVESYRHMTGWRWGVNLDETCDRDVRFIPENLLKCNSLETDLLKYIWNTMGYEGAAVT